MIDEYYIVEWDLPVIEGACTIGGSPGFGTPATCTDQPNGATTIRTYRFTDTSRIIDDGVYPCCLHKEHEANYDNKRWPQPGFEKFTI